MNPKRQRRLVECGEGPFSLPTNRKPSTETGAAHIICHPELAKDLTEGQPALGHHSPFSKLTAPPGEPSVPTTCRLKRTSRSPREILRRLRMTTFGAPFSLLRPSAHRCGGKQALPQSYNTLARPQRATASPLRMVSCPFQVEIRMSVTANNATICPKTPLT